MNGKLKYFLHRYYAIIKIVNKKSYYPEKPRKNIFTRVWDNIRWSTKYKEPNRFYNLYGMDIKGKKVINTNYIDLAGFFKNLDQINDVEQSVFLRDKYQFFKLMFQNGIDTPSVIEKVIINSTAESKILTEKYKSSDVFIKTSWGQCAEGVYHIAPDSEDVVIPNGEYIVQNKVIQHPKMSALYPNSVNTIRIVTVFVEGKAEILCSGLRVGTSVSGSVDNWAAGGIFVGIINGKLTKYGFFKPTHQGIGKCEYHPDTNIKLYDYEIPYYDEVVELVKKAQRLLPKVRAIGWDVAITESGPTIIEGNDNWEITLMQVGVPNGLKKEWLHYYDIMKKEL